MVNPPNGFGLRTPQRPDSSGVAGGKKSVKNAIKKCYK